MRRLKKGLQSINHRIFCIVEFSEVVGSEAGLLSGGEIVEAAFEGFLDGVEGAGEAFAVEGHEKSEGNAVFFFGEAVEVSDVGADGAVEFDFAVLFKDDRVIPDFALGDVIGEKSELVVLPQSIAGMAKHQILERGVDGKELAGGCKEAFVCGVLTVWDAFSGVPGVIQFVSQHSIALFEMVLQSGAGFAALIEIVGGHVLPEAEDVGISFGGEMFEVVAEVIAVLPATFEIEQAEEIEDFDRIDLHWCC